MMRFKEEWLQAIVDLMNMVKLRGQFAEPFTKSDVQRVLMDCGVVVEKKDE